MHKILRTNADHTHFIGLVQMLDADLAARDGNEHGFYAQFNTITAIKHAVLLYVNEIPVSCGAIKAFDDECMEVKRMYTLVEQRGKGHAVKVLNELEAWAAELGYRYCVLETGRRQPEAIALYEKSGYTITENYGQYIGVENSVCFRKQLT